MITTARLLIREFTESDFPALFTLVSNPEVMRFSDGTESEMTARERLARYRRSYRQRGFGKWAVEEKKLGRVIGYCGFGIEEFDGSPHPEIGFRFLPQFWGLGLATEAAASCVSYASIKLKFEHYLGFAHPENFASRRVLEKLGMRFVGDRLFHGDPVVVYQKNNAPNNATQAPPATGADRRVDGARIYSDMQNVIPDHSSRSAATDGRA